MNNNVGGQIASELGQIAKDVGKQVVSVPKDVAGAAMESLGASSGKSTKGQTVVPAGTATEATAWEKMDVEPNARIRRSLARKALEELAGKKLQRKEPSIWEKLQQEQEQKKQAQQQQAAAAAAANVPMPAAKRPRGDLYGAKAKKTATENRNVRQD